MLLLNLLLNFLDTALEISGLLKDVLEVLSGSSIEHGGTRTFFILMAMLALQNAYSLFRWPPTRGV